ncbi:MAG: hypothetical protein ACR2G6_01665 [Gemmatimonadaceae bacterium]
MPGQSSKSSGGDSLGDRRAGLAALVAAAAWLTWVVLDASTGGALDGPRSGPNAAWGWLGTGLLVTWTGLVVPAALALCRALRRSAPRVVPAATAAGIFSLGLWGVAALARWWPAGLEPAFLALSAVWWLGIARPLRGARPRLGTLTLALGVAAACDAIVTAGEGRLPGWTFPVFGGAKLPLQLVWTITVGVALWRGTRLHDVRRLQPAALDEHSAAPASKGNVPVHSDQ